MIKAVVAFVLILVLSLVFHLILGGNQQINLEQTVININLKDLLLSALLLANLIAILLLLQRKG